MIELLIGFCIGWIIACCYNDLMSMKLWSCKFKVGDTVYWRCVEEVGDTNSQWTVTLKKGTVVSSDVRVCIEEDNEDKTLIFLEKEKLYTQVSKLKNSIGAELSIREILNEEASRIIL